ncbi:MAG: hypothetical protein JXO44_02630 [Clostridia bacterium]|nr:hypothetical protein [Clostridia bacterium]
MYKQFIKNMDSFLRLNISEDDTSNYRFDLVKEMEIIRSAKSFNELKNIDLKRYQKLSTMIWAIKNNTHKYPSFKAFSWELWAYGFDGDYYKVDEKELEEQLRLIDLLLSTQYWH